MLDCISCQPNHGSTRGKSRRRLLFNIHSYTSQSLTSPSLLFESRTLPPPSPPPLSTTTITTDQHFKSLLPATSRAILLLLLPLSQPSKTLSHVAKLNLSSNKPSQCLPVLFPTTTNTTTSSPYKQSNLSVLHSTSKTLRMLPLHTQSMLSERLFFNVVLTFILGSCISTP